MLNARACADDKPATGDRQAANTAAITGTVHYAADAKRPWRYARYYVGPGPKYALSGTLVCLVDAKLAKHAPAREPVTHVIDQKDFIFIPETLAIRAMDRVKFTNGDFSVHNVFSNDDLHPFDITIAKGDEAIETFKKPGGSRRPVLLGCKFHGSMRAWVYVFDHPWYALTGKEGAFRIDGIPPGTYRLDIVHSAGNMRTTRRIELKAGQTQNIEITLSPENIPQLDKNATK